MDELLNMVAEHQTIAMFLVIHDQLHKSYIFSTQIHCEIKKKINIERDINETEEKLDKSHLLIVLCAFDDWMLEFEAKSLKKSIANTNRIRICCVNYFQTFIEISITTAFEP